jgi:hypothetical protein
MHRALQSELSNRSAVVTGVFAGSVSGGAISGTLIGAFIDESVGGTCTATDHGMIFTKR